MISSLSESGDELYNIMINEQVHEVLEAHYLRNTGLIEF